MRELIAEAILAVIFGFTIAAVLSAGPQPGPSYHGPSYHGPQPAVLLPEYSQLKH